MAAHFISFGDSPVPEETFDFDTFFVDDSDAGEDVPVTVRGHTFTVTVKRGLSLGDREAAKSVATKSHVSPTGALVIDNFDTTAFTVEMLARMIKGWSLPRPATRANVVAMGADVSDALQTALAKYLNPPTEEALAPFAPQSDAA